jgi:hypothetical protein
MGPSRSFLGALAAVVVVVFAAGDRGVDVLVGGQGIDRMEGGANRDLLTRETNSAEIRW